MISKTRLESIDFDSIESLSNKIQAVFQRSRTSHPLLIAAHAGFVSVGHDGVLESAIWRQTDQVEVTLRFTPKSPQIANRTNSVCCRPPTDANPAFGGHERKWVRHAPRGLCWEHATVCYRMLVHCSEI